MARSTAILAIVAISTLPAFAKDKKPHNPKRDPTQIGDRNVAKGLNFYTVNQDLGMTSGALSGPLSGEMTTAAPLCSRFWPSFTT